MIKITFMGAGSTVFARNVLGDCMCTPALRESEIALYDIDEKRLEDSRIILSAINHNVNEDRAVIKTYLGAENRKDALRDADFVQTLRSRRNTASNRPSQIPWESAESCVHFVQFRFWKSLHGIWKRSARTLCS